MSSVATNVRRLIAKLKESPDKTLTVQGAILALQWSDTKVRNYFRAVTERYPDRFVKVASGGIKFIGDKD